MKTIQFNISKVSEVTGNIVCSDPETVLDFYRSEIVKHIDTYKEHVIVLCLNSRHRLTGWHIVSIGSLSECLAHPREVLLPVIMNRSHSFIMIHNHPSGDPSPSSCDRSLTRRIKDGAELLSLPFLDHIIVTENDIPDCEPYFSFREMGMI